MNTSMTDQPAAAIPSVSKKQNIFVGYIVDALAPIAFYLILNRLGVSTIVSLVIGSAIAVVSTVVNTIRNKGLDKFGVLVIVEIAASIALLFTTRDPRFLLAKPSIYATIAAVFLIYSAFAGRPATIEGAKPMATKGDPARTAAYEAAWESSPQFRAAHRIATLGWGLIFLIDSIARVAVVYTFPIERAAWLSGLPHIACIVALIGFSALMGRRLKRIVEGLLHPS